MENQEQNNEAGVVATLAEAISARKDLPETPEKLREIVVGNRVVSVGAGYAIEVLCTVTPNPDRYPTDFLGVPILYRKVENPKQVRIRRMQRISDQSLGGSKCFVALSKMLKENGERNLYRGLSRVFQTAREVCEQLNSIPNWREYQKTWEAVRVWSMSTSEAVGLRDVDSGNRAKILIALALRSKEQMNEVLSKEQNLRRNLIRSCVVAIFRSALKSHWEETLKSRIIIEEVLGDQATKHVVGARVLRKTRGQPSEK